MKADKAMSVSYESVLIRFRKTNDSVQSLKGIPEVAADADRRRQVVFGGNHRPSD